MQVATKPLQLFDERVSLRPDADCLRHVPQAPAVSEHRRHSFDILRTIPALDQTSADNAHVRNSLFQLQARLPVSQRHEKRLLIGFEISLRVRD